MDPTDSDDESLGSPLETPCKEVQLNIYKHM